MTDMAGTVPVIAVDKVQAVALAVCTYYFGVWLKGKVGVLSRYSIPSPVVGGMSFAIVVSFLEYFNIVKVQIDSTLQTVLMLGFFTTIGLMASLRVVKDGGRLLLGFLLADVELCGHGSYVLYGRHKFLADHRPDTCAVEHRFGDLGFGDGVVFR